LKKASRDMEAFSDPAPILRWTYPPPGQTGVAALRLSRSAILLRCIGEVPGAGYTTPTVWPHRKEKRGAGV
jgi:hypothetical protein